MSNIPLTDLRISNIIGVNRPGYAREYYIIDSIIGSSRVHVFTKNGIQSVGQDYIFGIPISEEWLKAQGFKKTMWSDCKNGYNIDDVLYFDFDNKSIGAFDCGSLCLSKRCDFIHDFQNCIYFLTGTELTLKQ